MGEAVRAQAEARWGPAVGRLANVTFALGTAALVGNVVWRLPAAAWPLLLPVVVYEGMAAAFALVATRGRAYARTPGEVVLPILSTWLYPLAALALGDRVRRYGLALDGVDALTLATYAWLVWALLVLRRNFSILPEVRTLVTRGPYAWIRHPLYLGYVVLWLVGAWETADPTLILLALLSVALFERRAAMEERKLRSHVPAYAAYMARTWRLVPGLGRAPAR